jgi:hypothetical protein
MGFIMSGEENGVLCRYSDTEKLKRAKKKEPKIRFFF